MPAAFGAFGDHGIGAKALHTARKRGSGNHGDHLDAGFFPHVHVVGGAAGARGDHVDFQVHQKARQLGGVGIHEHDVRAKGLVRDGAGSAHLLFDPRQRSAAARDDAKPARLADGAGQAGVGDARHSTLDDGHLDAQKFGDASIHFCFVPLLARCRQHTTCARFSYPSMLVQRRDHATRRRSVSRYLRVAFKPHTHLTCGYECMKIHLRSKRAR